MHYMTTRRTWRKRKFSFSQLSRYLVPVYFLLLTVILYLLIYGIFGQNYLLLALFFGIYLVSGLALGDKRRKKKGQKVKSDEKRPKISSQFFLAIYDILKQTKGFPSPFLPSGGIRGKITYLLL